MSYKSLIVLNLAITAAFFGAVAAFAQTADTTAPVISGVAASAITQTSATIGWTTDEAADGQVEYGTSTAYAASSTLATATTTAHSVSLTGLTASTTYHYLVKSKDVAGNLATSSDFMFTTLVQSTATTTPPTATSTVTVKVKVEPKTLNSRSTGKWIEAEVKFPKGTDIRTIDLASIKLNNTLAPVKVKTSKAKWYETIAFSKKEPKVEMKFVRKDVINLLLASTATTTEATATSTTPVVKIKSVTTVKDLTISGTIGGATFSGATKIKFTSPVAVPSDVQKVRKQEKNEKHDEKNEKERDEHRSATSTSAVSPTATTTAQGVVIAPVTKKEEKKHKEEKREERKDEKKGNKENKDR